MTRVGFVGAGRMGAPMVRRLVDAGHDVRALGRTDEKREAVRELGAQAVADLAEVGRGADVVVVCVFTDEQVQQVCLDSDLLSAVSPGRGARHPHHGKPARPRRASPRRAPAVDVVDAPVSGGPHDIAAGEVTLFVGGSDDAVARVRPVLAAYGDPILHVGPIGAGPGRQADQQHAVRRPDRPAARRPSRWAIASASTRRSCWRRSRTAAGRAGLPASSPPAVRWTRSSSGSASSSARTSRWSARSPPNWASDLGLLDDVINAGIRP